MRRLRAFDLVLAAIFIPLWLGCFVLHLKEVSRGRLAWIPIFVSASAEARGYPVVREFWVGVKEEQAGVKVGDQLLRVGVVDLKGVGPFAFVAYVYDQMGADLRVPLTFLRNGERGEAVLPLMPVRHAWRTIPLALGFFVTAVLALLYETGSRPVRAYFLGSLAYSAHWMFFFGGPFVQTYVWIIVFFIASSVMFPVALRAAMIFPERLMLAGTRVSPWPWGFAVFGPLSLSWIFGSPLPPTLALRAVFIVNILFLVVFLGVLARNYRRATPLGRRRLRWIVYGFYVGTAPMLAANLVTAFNPALWWLLEISALAAVVLPLCICIALLQLNFWDIDRLISTTTVYSLLTLVFLAGVLLGVPRVAQAMQETVGIQAGYGQFALSFCLVLVLAPGKRVLLPKVVQRFFPEQYELEAEVAALTRELRQHTNLSTLLAFGGERVKLLWDLESCVLYGRNDGAYVPILARGSAIPAVFAERSTLSSALQTQTMPLEVERWQRVTGAYLTPVDLAALEKLRAEVIVPLYRDKQLVAFVCLGPKRSGDIYTTTDFVLLTTVGKALGAEFERHDEEEWRSQVADMYETLRSATRELSSLQLPPTTGSTPE
ncbi:MAG: hypothetical protein AB7P69_02260 [Candidatus Binatia bacterium]